MRIVVKQTYIAPKRNGWLLNHTVNPLLWVYKLKRVSLNTAGNSDMCKMRMHAAFDGPNANIEYS